MESKTSPPRTRTVSEPPAKIYTETAPPRRQESAQQGTLRQETVQRGNFYFALGFALLAGLLVVIGLGIAGITSLGIFELSTAMAMIAIAIIILAAVSFVTLVTLRRTIKMLSTHETALQEQSRRHADLADKVQSQWRAEQIIRDRKQDEDIAAISAAQDSRPLANEARTNGVSRKGTKAKGSAYNPFEGGQVHPVRDVEGIGEHYGTMLDDLDLEDTEQLWNADPTYVAGALKIRPRVVENWQCMCELMAVTGIGKQYAELLVRADVSSIDALCNEKAPALLARIQTLEKRQGHRIQGNTIGTKAVQGWIDAAQEHNGSSSKPAVVAFSSRRGA